MRDQISEEQQRNPLDIKIVQVLIEHLPGVGRQRLPPEVRDPEDSQRQVDDIGGNKKRNIQGHDNRKESEAGDLQRDQVSLQDRRRTLCSPAHYESLCSGSRIPGEIHQLVQNDVSYAEKKLPKSERDDKPCQKVVCSFRHKREGHDGEHCRNCVRIQGIREHPQHSTLLQSKRWKGVQNKEEQFESEQAAILPPERQIQPRQQGDYDK